MGHCINPVWDLGDCFLSHVGEVSSYYLIKHFPRPLLSSLSEMCIMWIWGHLMLFQRSLKLLYIYFFLFSLFYFMAMISTTLPAHWSILLLHLFCYWFLLVFFISVTLFNSIWLFFTFSNSLLKTSCNFLLCASILLLKLWLIFMIVTLNFFLGRFLVIPGFYLILVLHLEHILLPSHFL